MIRSEIKRRQYSNKYQSEGSHLYAAWANNHNGWGKMKKKNRRIFKKRFKRETMNMIKKELEDNHE